MSTKAVPLRQLSLEFAPSRRSELAAGRLERVLDLPHGNGEDRPEGFVRLSSGELLVVYDGPAQARLAGDHGVLADVFAFPLP